MRNIGYANREQDEMRLLLVEKHSLLGNELKSHLCQHGFVVDWLKDDKQAGALINKNEHFDLSIWDVDTSGVELDRWLNIFHRNHTDTPILGLIGNIELLNESKLPIDDYILKRLLNKTLLLRRIRALLRLSFRSSSNNAIMRYQNITMNTDTREVMVDDKPIDLSRREWDLLEQFFKHRGTVITKDRLAQSIYGWENNVDSNAIEVHVYNLRKKLSGLTIKTLRGIGYMLSDTQDSERMSA